VGHYSVRQEQFLTDKERREDGTFGEEWGEVIELEEANWYFKLSEHVEWLKAYIRSHPDLHLPSFSCERCDQRIGFHRWHRFAASRDRRIACHVGIPLPVRS